MQAIAIHPSHGQVTGMLMGMVALVALMVALPALALPVAFLLPLFACPLVGTKKQWAVIPAVIAPGLVSLLTARPLLYSMSMLFPCGAPVITAALLYPQKPTLATALRYFLAAFAFGMVMALLGLRSLYPGELAAGLADAATAQIAASPDGMETLYSLTMGGFLPLPDDFLPQGPLRAIMDPLWMRQQLLSFRLRLGVLLEAGLPMMVAQGGLLCALFTALRVQRLHHSYLLVENGPKERVRLLRSPGFANLQLPSNANRALLFLGLAGMLLSSGEAGWLYQLGLLCYNGFLAAYQILGAAALMGLLLKKHPEAKGFFGATVALLYLLLPTVLFLLGILDPLLHFRRGESMKSEEEDEG